MSADEKFGAVILDPPKFARSRALVDDALRAYHRLNRLAVDVLEPGGILVTCSCSGHVTREDFFYMLLGVAEQTGRDIQVLEMRGAAPDHPAERDLPGERVSEVLYLPGGVRREAEAVDEVGNSARNPLANADSRQACLFA